MAELAEADGIYAYTFVCTNIDVSTPGKAVAVECWYRQRTTIENIFRDSKHGAALRHLPSGYAEVNTAWMHGALLAANIAAWLHQLTGTTNVRDGPPDRPRRTAHPPAPTRPRPARRNPRPTQETPRTALTTQPTRAQPGTFGHHEPGVTHRAYTMPTTRNIHSKINFNHRRSTQRTTRRFGSDHLFAGPAIGWHYETGVQLLRLIFSGALDRHPELQLVVGHWGEVVLFFLDRISMMLDPARLGLRRPIADYFRENVSYTGSGELNHRYLRWTIEVVGVERLLMATDYPFVDTGGGAARRFLDDADLTDSERDAIAHGNWERLTEHLR